ncbi:hypothetical protein [Polyangium fumosum]|uniref:Uncharacterized protein n=1 Tax=Polyangium fumosum TaxID=889272 RepID=A0A4U1JEB9_9BACT|nr:hypothetical protein [Polyangium fumosum]TKD09140.1 hypothetical protein E8A74_12695 [Polyangium fumosum]
MRDRDVNPGHLRAGRVVRLQEALTFLRGRVRRALDRVEQQIRGIHGLPELHEDHAESAGDQRIVADVERGGVRSCGGCSSSRGARTIPVDHVRGEARLLRRVFERIRRHG